MLEGEKWADRSIQLKGVWYEVLLPKVQELRRGLMTKDIVNTLISHDNGMDSDFPSSRIMHNPSRLLLPLAGRQEAHTC